MVILLDEKTGRNKTTLSSIKMIRIVANKPAADNASDISSSIGMVCDVIEEVIVDLKSMAKEVVVLLYGDEVILYPGEYEVVSEEK